MDISDITLIITTGFIASTSLISLAVALCSSNTIISNDSNDNSTQIYSLDSDVNSSSYNSNSYENFISDDSESLGSSESVVSSESNSEVPSIDKHLNNTNNNNNDDSLRHSIDRIDRGIEILQNNQICLDQFINDRVTYLEMEQEKLIDFIYQANIANQKRITLFKKLLNKIKNDESNQSNESN